MKVLILLFCFVLFQSYAHALIAGFSERSYTFGQSKVPFVYDEKKGILVSKNCFKNKNDGPKLDCDAIQLLENVSFTKIEKQLSRGGNPGNLICNTQLKGTVVVGIDSKGSKSSFCKLKNGPIIGNNTLINHSMTNDMARRRKKTRINRSHSTSLGCH